MYMFYVDPLLLFVYLKLEWAVDKKDTFYNIIIVYVNINFKEGIVKF